jgi:hypothetical protein
MKALTDALYGRMDEAASLAAYLPLYPVGGTHRAIFPDPPPFRNDADAPEAFIVLGAPLSDSEGPFASKTHASAREVIQDVRCYARRGATLASLMKAQLMAEAVRALFHRQRFAVGDQQVRLCEVLGPVAAPTSSEDVTGRLLTIRAVIA